MQLNLPILEILADCQSILIAGVGGGQDVLSGLPIYFALQAAGKDLHLANLSFTPVDLVPHISDTELFYDDLVYATKGDITHEGLYFPEGFLAQWFREVHQQEVTVWMLRNTGAAPLTRAYRQLTDHLQPDAIILVDGGVDSLMRGDESGSGTLIEDSLTLAAVDPLDIPVKILACIGFGTEVEENLCHYHALENIAALAKEGAFYGSCALTPQMEVFQQFEAACRYVWEQPKHPRSHISTRIIPAAHGEFGNFQMYQEERPTPIFVSPLMSLYLFFDAEKVIARSLIIDALRNTESKSEAFQRYVHLSRSFNMRPRRKIPYD